MHNCSLFHIEVTALTYLTNLEWLDLSDNSLSFISKFLLSFNLKLIKLDLRGNQLVQASNSFIEHLDKLRWIRSDWYSLCCFANLVYDCKPQPPTASACLNLLTSPVQVYLVVSSSGFTIFVNLLALALLNSSNSSERLPLTYLAIYYLLFGIYLCIIAFLDSQANLTSVLNLRVSILCLFAAVFNFIATQMSLITQFVIFLSRAIILGSMSNPRYIKRKVNMACIIVLVVFILCAAVLALYTQSNQQVGFESINMCMFFGIEKQIQIKQTKFILYAVFICVNSIIISGNAVVHFVLLNFALRQPKIRSTGKPLTLEMTLRRSVMVLFTLLPTLIYWIPYMTFIALSLSGTHTFIDFAWFITLASPFEALVNPLFHTFNSPYVRKKLMHFARKCY